VSNISLETSLKLSQTLSPQMIQSLKLLQYSNLQLEQVIRKEILENPILEETAEEEAAPGTQDEAPGEAVETATAEAKEEEVAEAASIKTFDEEDSKAVIPESSPIEEVNWGDFENEPYAPAYRKGLEEDEEGTSEIYEKIPISIVSLE
jgi:DNA-directed RNA polymerase specialized sigma54-like protein